jgi:hypothetical protein
VFSPPICILLSEPIEIYGSFRTHGTAHKWGPIARSRFSRELKVYLRMKALLQLDQINPQIRDTIKIYVLDKIIYKPTFLVDRLFIANRITKYL